MPRATRTVAVLLAGALGSALFAMADARAEGAPATARRYVLFVCEHGNVKSLMAAQYFARLAAARGLPLGAEARGTAPNSTSVPPPIVAGLRGDGYDVATFVPRSVTAADLAGAIRVVVIGVTLSTSVANGTAVVERWDDVPAASEDFAGARAALLRHLDKLLRGLPTH